MKRWLTTLYPNKQACLGILCCSILSIPVFSEEQQFRLEFFSANSQPRSGLENQHQLFAKKKIQQSKGSVIAKSSSNQPQPFVQATKKARQSVVAIFVTSKDSDQSWEQLGGGAISPSRHELTTSTDEENLLFSRGSGFIISPDGYIVTNNHVVENAEIITVQLLEGTEYSAELVERDPTSDIALIKINAENLPALSFADSSKVEIGEWVIAIGNPFGLQASVSTGIVSADERSLSNSLMIQEFFQTDATINPGNSGGPLVNLDGDVIGMNTGAVTTGGGSIGLGFSIPSNLIQKVLPDLYAQNRPSRGSIGALLYPIDPPIKHSLGLDNHQGVIVVAVAPEGPAGVAGLRPGDVILKLQNQPIRELGQLRTSIAFAKPGDTLSLLILRDSQFLTLTPVVEIEPEHSLSAQALENELGIHLQPTFLASKNGADTQKGLLVFEIDTSGLAYRAGLRPGQIIIEANGKTVSSIEDLAEEVFRITFRSLTILHVLENGKGHSVSLFR